MIKWDVASGTSRQSSFPIASVRRLTMQGIEQRNGEEDGVGGTWQGPVAESEDLDQRAKEWCRDRSTGASSRERRGPKLMVQRSGFDLNQEIHRKLSGTNTTQRICRPAVGVSIVLLERCQTCNIRDTVQISTCPTRRWTTASWTPSRTASRWLLLYFLDCKSGYTFACPVDKGWGNFPLGVICKGLEFCGRRRFVFKTDNEHAISALSTAVRLAQWNCRKSRRKSQIRHFINFTAVWSQWTEFGRIYRMLRH